MDEQTKAIIESRRQNLQGSLAQVQLELMQLRQEVTGRQHALDQIVGHLAELEELETALSRPAEPEPPAA